jgi:hypothetical protein
MAKAHILIATPTTGSVKSGYMGTIIATMNNLRQRGIECEWQAGMGPDIAHQRNILATEFLSRKHATHLFFVDSDMMFPNHLCATLLAQRKPIVGTVYTRRSLDLSRLQKAVLKGVPIQSAHLFGFDWHLYRRDEAQPISVRDHLLEVHGLGFGAILIQRTALETMIEKGAARLQEVPGVGKVYNFFGVRPAAAVEGMHISEDFSFGDRWCIDCGEQMWAYVAPTIIHVGDFGFGGSYFSFLEAVNELEHSRTTP